MRISVNEDLASYVTEVRLDGVVQENVIRLDTDEGWVVRIRPFMDGEIPGNYWPHDKIEGKIEVDFEIELSDCTSLVSICGPENSDWWRSWRQVEGVWMGYLPRLVLSSCKSLVLWEHPLAHMYRAFTMGMTRPGDIVEVFDWIDRNFWRPGARGIKGRPGR